MVLSAQKNRLLAGFFLCLRRQNHVYLQALACFLVPLVLYWPGTSGPFLLDDIGNLSALEGLKAGFTDFWLFVSSGFAGPTGRPLSLLTFAWQADAWPVPVSFKQFNILLHSANCVLLWALLRKSLQLCDLALAEVWWPVALTVALIWAILPIHVSTTLYVIQRMVLLASFFSLLGLLLFLFSAQYFAEGRALLGRCLALLSLVVCGLLATLSKESGVLLVLYTAVLGHFLRFKDVWLQRLLLLGAAVLLLVIIVYGGLFASYQSRNFTLLERLLTQSVVVWEYVGQILLPRAEQLGIYHQEYQVSRHVNWPVLVAVAGWACVLVVACRVKSAPVVRFSIFWFVAGHLLESTLLPLELYFEHRNYLPSIGVVMLSIYVATCLLSYTRASMIKRLITAGLALWLVMLAWITHGQVQLWGDTGRLAQVEAHRHRLSPRAQLALLNYYSEQGARQDYFRQLASMQRQFPDMAQLKVTRVSLACRGRDSGWLPKVEAFYPLQFSYGAASGLIDVAKRILNEDCVIDLSYYRAVIEQVLRNDKYKRFRDDFNKYIAIIYMRQGKFSEAVESLGEPKGKRIELRLLLARLLAMQGDLQGAKQRLDRLQAELSIKDRLLHGDEIGLLAKNVDESIRLPEK